MQPLAVRIDRPRSVAEAEVRRAGAAVRLAPLWSEGDRVGGVLEGGRVLSEPRVRGGAVAEQDRLRDGGVTAAAAAAAAAAARSVVAHVHRGAVCLAVQHERVRVVPHRRLGAEDALVREGRVARRLRSATDAGR